VPEWLAAGAVACGVGSALTRGTAAEISARVETLLRSAHG
jgi:2-dehydro-3-deoxyphosphogluconate aldolase/(4S)-4-hydroxy-2-oxoglutarate aldolase